MTVGFKLNSISFSNSILNPARHHEIVLDYAAVLYRFGTQACTHADSVWRCRRVCSGHHCRTMGCGDMTMKRHEAVFDAAFFFLMVHIIMWRRVWRCSRAAC